ncbi:hypothetical protein GHT09_000455 [Marmota monax]|uniref:Uncharacterized protein n=1 Tax=Marmota monax TaxID=9995 RepID=A0A834QZ01_MARMO|nr:hypothetical protein GHT09_000455 [Marmota monax]
MLPTTTVLRGHASFLAPVGWWEPDCASCGEAGAMDCGGGIGAEGVDRARGRGQKPPPAPGLRMKIQILDAWTGRKCPAQGLLASHVTAESWHQSPPHCDPAFGSADCC